MQSYYELLAPAVARLDENTGDARRALYDRARTALVAQLRGVDPPLDNSDIIREQLALEDAICNVEVDCRSLENFERIQLKAPKRPGMVMRILRALALTQPAAPAARRSGRPGIERRQIRNGRLPPQNDSMSFLDSRGPSQRRRTGTPPTNFLARRRIGTRDVRVTDDRALAPQPKHLANLPH
jgi:hypothetical protein